MFCDLFILICCVITVVNSNLDIEESFTKCELDSSDFDDCIKEALNRMPEYFKEGFPEYSIGALDPIYIPEVRQKRRFNFMDYNLILSNVTEAGWSESYVTKVRTDFSEYQMEITQFFPDKRLDGMYEIEGTFFGQKVFNRGSWNLSLYDYVQTLTIIRKPVKEWEDHEDDHPPLRVTCSIHSCQKLNLHIDHLAGGRPIVENTLDWIINTAWQPGFIILRPLINDLVGKAFTDVFNDNFQFFPFENVWHSLERR